MNAVSPGSILSPGGDRHSSRDRAPEHFAQFIKRDSPPGRLSTPEEVTDIVTSSLSERTG